MNFKVMKIKRLLELLLWLAMLSLFEGLVKLHWLLTCQVGFLNKRIRYYLFLSLSIILGVITWRNSILKALQKINQFVFNICHQKNFNK